MSTKSETLALALQQHQAGNLAQAEQLYRSLLQVGSSDPMIWCYLGTAQLAQGKPAEAEASYRQALGLRPQMVEAHADLGIALAQQGRLDEAAGSLRQALALRPQHPEAHSNLGVILNQAGRPDEAAGHLQEALRLRPDYAEAYNNLGTVYQGQARLADAAACYRKALQLQPQYTQAQQNLQGVLQSVAGPAPVPLTARPATLPVDDPARQYNVRGIHLAQERRWDEAVACFREAIRLRPDYTDAHNNLGNVLYLLGNLDEAIPCYEEALRHTPDHAGACSNLGEVLRQKGRLADGLRYCARAVELQPNLASAQNHLGLALSAGERFEEALPHCQEAVRLQPDLAEAHHGLGHVLLQLRRVDEAVAALQTALRLKPELAEAHTSLGAALLRQGKTDEALASLAEALRIKPGLSEPYLHRAQAQWQMGQFDEAEASCALAIRHKPDSPEGHNMLGVIRMKKGHPAEAVGEFTRALALRPEFPQAHFNRGLARLLMGDYKNGWADYEWRWRCRDFVTRPVGENEGWDGSPLAGRAILLHAEQGMGDTLQFVRFVPQLKQQGGTIVLACAAPLIPILSRCAGIDQVIDNKQVTFRFDLEAPLLSLPRRLGITLENVPAKVPYLFGDPALEERWHKELARFPGFKIGIAWQGNRDHPEDRLRSAALTCFAPLAREGVHLINLQLGPGREQLDALDGRFPVIELAPRSQDAAWTFLDTAAVMKSLDLVIAVDTAVAHLAGGLGVPVWVALAFAPDWRWLLDREDTPWYPTMRLFRQTHFGAWDEVFARMAGELTKRLAPRRRSRGGRASDSPDKA